MFERTTRLVGRLLGFGESPVGEQDDEVEAAVEPGAEFGELEEEMQQEAEELIDEMERMEEDRSEWRNELSKNPGYIAEEAIARAIELEEEEGMTIPSVETDSDTGEWWVYTNAETLTLQVISRGRVTIPSEKQDEFGIEGGERLMVLIGNSIPPSSRQFSTNVWGDGRHFTIPKNIRDFLHIEKGDEVDVELHFVEESGQLDEDE